MGHTGFNRQFRRFLFSAIAFTGVLPLFDFPNSFAAQPLPSDRTDIVVPCAGALRKAQGSFDLDEFATAKTTSGKDIFEKCISVFGLCGDVYNGAPYKPGSLDVGTAYASQQENQAKDVAPTGGFTAEHIASRAGVIPTVVDRLIVQVANRIQNFYRGYDTNLKFDSAASENGTFDDLKASSMWRSKEEIDRFSKSGSSAFCTNIGACNTICGEGRPEKMSFVRIPSLPTENPSAVAMFANNVPTYPLPSQAPCPNPDSFKNCPVNSKDSAAMQAATRAWNAAVGLNFATQSAATIVDGNGQPISQFNLVTPSMSWFVGKGPLKPSNTGEAAGANGSTFSGWPTSFVAFNDNVNAICANPANQSIAVTSNVNFQSVAWDDGTFLAPGTYTGGDCDLYIFQDYSQASTMSAMMTGAYAQATWVQLNEVIDEINSGTLSLTSENCRALANTFFSQLKSAISTLDSSGNACGKTLPEIEAQCSSIENTQSECYEKALVGQIQVSGFNRIAECEVYSRAYSMFNQAFITGPTLGAGSVMVSQLKNWATLGCARAMAGYLSGMGDNLTAIILTLQNTLNVCFPYAYAAVFNRYLETVSIDVPTLKTGAAGKQKTFSLARIQQGSWKSANISASGAPVTEMVKCDLKDSTPPPTPVDFNKINVSPINATSPTATPTTGSGG